MKILLMLFAVSLVSVSCNKVSKEEYCSYAKVQPKYSFLGMGEEIKGCETLSAESIEEEAFGEKVVTHKVKLKLTLEQVTDDCHSGKAISCNLLGHDCIMDGDKKAHPCKYSDAQIVKKKGDKREMVRSLSLIAGKSEKLSVLQNIESK